MIVAEDIFLPDLTREEIAQLFAILSRGRTDAERALCRRVSDTITEQLVTDAVNLPLA